MAANSQGTRNTSDEVYSQLRKWIVSGEFRPNERLVEVDLAQRLGVSRTPIRESMQRLAAGGLVINRRRGWVVREHTVDEIRDAYEVRAGLEGIAARLAAGRVTPIQLRRIERFYARTRAAAMAANSRHELVEANEEFHSAVYEAAANPRLSETIARNHDLFFNYNVGMLYTDEEAEASIAGHAGIVEALKARDGDAADATCRKHLMEGLEIMLLRYRELPIRRPLMRSPAEGDS
jgi:DNA-binding GntR family transcriptional regulator